MVYELYHRRGLLDPARSPVVTGKEIMRTVLIIYFLVIPILSNCQIEGEYIIPESSVNSSLNFKLET